MKRSAKAGGVKLPAPHGALRTKPDKQQRRHTMSDYRNNPDESYSVTLTGRQWLQVTDLIAAEGNDDQELIGQLIFEQAGGQ